MFREIHRLRDVFDLKSQEALDQNDRLKALDFDLQKTGIRMNELSKIVESRNYDIRNKTVQLDDIDREIARLKELNSQ